MNASLTRLLIVGLLASATTGCQSASLGNYSWSWPKWPWSRNKDAALAANNAGATEASPWMPSQTATPGYGPNTAAGGGYNVGGPYGGNYAGTPTSYGADPSANPWAVSPAAGATAPSVGYDANGYPIAASAPPAEPQAGYYNSGYNAQPYGQNPAAGQPAAYGQTAMAPPPTNSLDPGAQYGGAPPTYPQYASGAAPMRTADSTQYPSNTQYDGQHAYPTTPPPSWNSGQPTAPPSGGAPSWDANNASTSWPPATQSAYDAGSTSYSPYQPPTGPTPMTSSEPYRPGGTGDYNPAGTAAPNTGSMPASNSYPATSPY